MNFPAAASRLALVAVLGLAGFAVGARADTKPLATVNGQAITQADVDDAMADIGQGLPPKLDDAARHKYVLDYLIFATGFQSEIDTREEFSLIAPHVRRWRDRFEPQSDLRNDDLGSSPDLDRNFALQERIAGTCPALAHIHSFNHGASLSLGKIAGDIPAISDGAHRLARAIAAMLFEADRDAHYAALQAFDTAELAGDEWADADANADVRAIDTTA